MTVYLVSFYDYDVCHHLGVFATEAQALAVVAAFEQHHPNYGVQVDAFEVDQLVARYAATLQTGQPL
jgi:hypothetical protein